MDPSIGKFADAKSSSQTNGILESIEYLVDSNNLVVESRVIDKFKNSLKSMPKNPTERFIHCKKAIDDFIKGI